MNPNPSSEQAELQRIADQYDSPLDLGIAREVQILRDGGVETFESCEGAPGHAYPEPTVRFHGGQAEGLRALSVAIAAGLHIISLRRTWPIIDSGPTGPWWELTFRQDAHHLFRDWKSPYTVALRRDEEGHIIARVLECPGCLGHGETAHEALACVSSMLEMWLDMDETKPEPMSDDAFSELAKRPAALPPQPSPREPEVRMMAANLYAAYSSHRAQHEKTIACDSEGCVPVAPEPPSGTSISCAICGTDIHLGDNYCPHCGTRFSDGPDTPPEPTGVPRKPEYDASKGQLAAPSTPMWTCGGCGKSIPGDKTHVCETPKWWIVRLTNYDQNGEFTEQTDGMVRGGAVTVVGPLKPVSEERLLQLWSIGFAAQEASGIGDKRLVAVRAVLRELGLEVTD